jgi:hypothetical protein
MIMGMLRTNDAICYAYLNDECIKTRLLKRQHRGTPRTVLKLSIPRPCPPCWGKTTFAGDDLHRTRTAWDYSARGGNQSLPLLGIAPPNPILLGDLAVGKTINTISAGKIASDLENSHYYGNLQACRGGTDLEFAREMTLSNPLGKYGLSDTGRPSIRRTLVFTILP